MKMGVMGAIHRAPCAAALPLRHVRARPIRCSSSSGNYIYIYIYAHIAYVVITLVKKKICLISYLMSLGQ